MTERVFRSYPSYSRLALIESASWDCKPMRIVVAAGIVHSVLDAWSGVVAVGSGVVVVSAAVFVGDVDYVVAVVIVDAVVVFAGAVDARLDAVVVRVVTVVVIVGGLGTVVEVCAVAETFVGVVWIVVVIAFVATLAVANIDSYSVTCVLVRFDKLSPDMLSVVLTHTPLTDE